MREPDWESLPIIAIAIVGIIGAVLIYNLLNEVVASEPLPELKAEPIGIIEELSGGHSEVNVDPVEEVAELPTERPSKPILSDEEIMAKVVHLEAKGESMIGKVAVAITILNRCDYYGKTVESVVFEPNQFSYDPDVKPYDSCYRAVIIAKLIKDFAPDLFPDTMMWFAAGDYHKGEHCGEPFIQIGNHFFNYLPEREDNK